MITIRVGPTGRSPVSLTFELTIYQLLSVRMMLLEGALNRAQPVLRMVKVVTIHPRVFAAEPPKFQVLVLLTERTPANPVMYTDEFGAILERSKRWQWR